MHMLGMIPRNEKKHHHYDECKDKPCDWHAPYNTQKSSREGTWLQISFDKTNPNWVRTDLKQFKL